jgi:hypothetical protein
MTATATKFEIGQRVADKEDTTRVGTVEYTGKGALEFSQRYYGVRLDAGALYEMYESSLVPVA